MSCPSSEHMVQGFRVLGVCGSCFMYLGIQGLGLKGLKGLGGIQVSEGSEFGISGFKVQGSGFTTPGFRASFRHQDRCHRDFPEFRAYIDSTQDAGYSRAFV